MTITLAFDVYGTLLDTQGVAAVLKKHVGPQAQAFSHSWREKQLEYSFRRALMQNYADFAACTAAALDYTAAQYHVTLDKPARDELLGAYRKLPAFADVPPCLAKARVLGYRMYAFSNGSAEAVEALLVHAGIREFFLDVVSVEETRSFKPAPAVYSHFMRKADAVGTDTWLVSGNPFDVIGALSFGMRAAWIKRSAETIFDPLGMAPTLTLKDLASLPERIALN